MKRFSNKATLSLQIVFAVVCAAIFVYLLCLMCSVLAADTSEEAAAAAFGFILIWIFLAIAAGVLIVPFILLMVFCKKPWIALPAYIALVLLVGISIAVVSSVSSSEASAAISCLTLLAV